MSGFIALELMIALCVAPCILCWILGEMHGAARMRALLRSAGGFAEPVGPISPPLLNPFADRAMRAEPSIKREAPEPASPAEEPILGPTLPPADPPSVATQIKARERRATFDDMPSLVDLHEQAQNIRNSARLWEDGEALQNLRDSDPGLDRILRHYQGSISAMAGTTPDRAANPEPKVEAKSKPHDATLTNGARLASSKRVID
ncbi:MAG: hypothetical protein AAF687_09370 [Pseudomonadota bacterium]